MKVWLVVFLFVAFGCSAVAVRESSNKKDFSDAIIKERLKEIRQ
jgi:uncharacterized membrane protein